MTGTKVHNFGRNVSSTPAVYAEPANEAELLQVLQRYRGQSIRVLASGHAWSDGICTDGVLLNVKHINHVRVRADRTSAWVGAGCQVKHVLRQLRTHGLTLPSVGLIDEQTVAGATATGTHGSGKQSLSHFIRSARIAHYDAHTGEPTITEIHAGAELQAVRCSLGLLGVIVELEMHVRAAYHIEEHSQQHGSLNSVLAAEHQYPLQQFYLMPWSWHLLGQHRVETTQPRGATAGLYRAYWHVGIDWGLHLMYYLLVKVLRVRTLIRAFYRYVMPLLIIKNWRVTDDSHAMLTMQHELFRHIEIEVFVTRSNLAAAIDHVTHTIAVFGGQKSPDEQGEPIPERYRGSYCHHYPICIRRIQPDDTLISMATPIADGDTEDWYAISLISYEWPSRRAGFFGFAEYVALSMGTRFQARCHWGKYNPLDGNANEQLYPRLPLFRDIVQRFDPDGYFANNWLRSVVLNQSPGR
jgi:FAD/FMN-containing dehydrogenase